MAQAATGTMKWTSASTSVPRPPVCTSIAPKAPKGAMIGTTRELCTPAAASTRGHRMVEAWDQSATARGSLLAITAPTRSAISGSAATVTSSGQPEAAWVTQPPVAGRNSLMRTKGASKVWVSAFIADWQMPPVELSPSARMPKVATVACWRAWMASARSERCSSLVRSSTLRSRLSCRRARSRATPIW